MKKADRVLLRIAALKRQQAESQYQAVVQKKRKMEAEITRLREKISGMSTEPAEDVQLMMVSQQYVERLIARIRGIEQARTALLPELQGAQHKLQKALFSESQLNLL